MWVRKSARPGREEFPETPARWHYYLGAMIAALPMPLVFDKGEFENGVAAVMMREFAKDPLPFLDEARKKKMVTA